LEPGKLIDVRGEYSGRPGADFSYIFYGENFGENPPKNVGKNGIFHGKSFEKLFFQEIPWIFPRKKMYEKSADQPRWVCGKSRPKCSPTNDLSKLKHKLYCGKK
jgi:hypothetical protein